MGWKWDEYNRYEYKQGGYITFSPEKFNPLNDISDAFILLEYLDILFGIEYRLSSYRSVDDIYYVCTIEQYWEPGSHESGIFDTPQEAICAAALEFVNNLYGNYVK